MKIQLLTLTTLMLLFLFPAPQTAWAELLTPNGTKFCKTCEECGYKSNGISGTTGISICIDRNCIAASLRSTSCKRCDSNFYLDGKFCQVCPQGATCDGYTILCNDGYYSSGSGCASCNSSCKTCSGSRRTQCTSCNSGHYLSNGSCLSCPANAICSGSSTFTCNSGYSNVDGKCVKNEQEPTKTNTVNSCPSRMTLSSDGCCCINK